MENETLCEFFKGRYTLPHLFHRLLKKEYVWLDDTLFTNYVTTPTRNVNVSKCSLLMFCPLKPRNYVLKNTAIYYVMKDDQN